MANNKKDTLLITLEGPPSVTEDGDLLQGDIFHLSGQGQGKEGVELARGFSGLLRPALEYRYDTSAEQQGSTFVGVVATRRRLEAAVNVFGDTPKEFRANWRRWMRNNRPQVESKLWFESSDSAKRYAFVRVSAEAATEALDTDPSLLRLVRDMPWTWESDYAYFFGEKERVEYDSSGTAVFRNDSDVDEVYPKIFLPGPGSYTVGDITTPTLTADEVVRINFNPEHSTYVKRNIKTGVVTNLWYLLNGKRPRWQLQPDSINTHKITFTNAESVPYLEYTPLYEGVF